MRRKKVLTLLMSAAVTMTSINLPAILTTAGAATVDVKDDTIRAVTENGSEAVIYKGVTFYRANADYNEKSGKNTVSYEGMPLFDGNEAHLDTYVDLVMKELGKDGWIAILAGGSVQGHYTDTKGEKQSYTFPTSIGRQADVGLDGETQWPNQLAQAQTWNKRLMKEAGSVYGSEIRGKSADNTISGSANNGAHVAQIDARINPLSGRYDEGYGEDSYLISEMTDSFTEGMGGDKDDTGLYRKSVALTKHWTTYNSEFFRCQGGNNVSALTFYNYYNKAAEKSLKNGNISGYMSSYGNINGIPATSTFIHDYAQNESKDGLITGCDFMAEYGYIAEQMHQNASAFSNGYDEHYSTNVYDRTASMLLAGHKQGGLPNTDFKKVINTLLDNKVEGLTAADIKKAARPTVVTMVRTGACDERDENGEPRFYPYSSEAKGGSEAIDHSSEISNKTAKQMADESIVLLKNNNNALPMKTGQKAEVYGQMANVFQYGQYSSEMAKMGHQYDGYGEGAGDTIVQAIKKKNGADNTTYYTGNRVVAYKGAEGYITATEDADGAQLTVSDVDANTVKTNKDYQFEYADWGQSAISLRSMANGKWLNTGISPNSLAGYTYSIYDTAVKNDADKSLKTTGYTALAVSNFPQFVEKQDAGDDQVYLKFGSKFNDTDFSSDWAVSNKMGWYVQSKDGKISLDGDNAGKTYDQKNAMNPVYQQGNLENGTKYFKAASDKSKYKFTEETIKAPGADSKDAAGDYAIVTIGQPYNGISGEGIDRKELNLSKDQMAMAQRVAENYAKAGKKTIVVINTDYPVEAETLQNDENISAIVYNPHGGQFSSTALADVLYGDVAPTGRLVSTWYKSEDALPSIDKYSLPNKAMVNIAGKELTNLTLDDLDKDLTVDMTDADLQQNNLTYMYANDDQITYPFGYGLSYSTFAYSGMHASVDENNNVKVSVTVKNTGDTKTADVVQIYAAKKSSAYGNSTPKKQLVGFSKVTLAPGARKTVTINVSAKSLETWDVNKEDYIVESGDYTFYAAQSSNLKAEAVKSDTVTLSGDKVSTVKTGDWINLWEHSYDANNIKFGEYSKGRTAEAAAADQDNMFACMSKGSDSWVAISSVAFKDNKKACLRVASTNPSNNVELHLDSPDGKCIGEASFGKTKAVTRKRAADNNYDAGSYTELGYKEVEINLTGVDSDAHNLYVVFKNADARVEGLKVLNKEEKSKEPKKQAKNSFTKKLSVKNAAYGTKISPSAKAKFGTVTYTYYKGKKKLSKAPTLPGTYKVKAAVKGTASYTGLSAEKTFKIGKKSLKVKVKKGSGKLTIKWTKVKGAAYQVKVGKKTYKVKATSKTVKVKRGKKYTVTVTAKSGKTAVGFGKKTVYAAK